jgi:hypothetical protein
MAGARYCQYCGEQVTRAAIRCRNCGGELGGTVIPKKSRRWWWVLAGLGALWLLRPGERESAKAPAVSAAIATPTATATLSAYRSVEELPAEPPLSAQIPMASVAIFENGVLDTCADFGLLLPEQVLEGMRSDAKKSKKPLPDNLAEDDTDGFLRGSRSTIGRLLGKPAESHDGVRTKNRCAEQFSGRAVLASCTLSRDAEDVDAGIRIAIRFAAQYYNFVTLSRNDSTMKQCLKVGGTWKTDSEELDRAKLDEHARRLNNAVDRLQKYTQ